MTAGNAATAKHVMALNKPALSTEAVTAAL